MFAKLKQLLKNKFIITALVFTLLGAQAMAMSATQSSKPQTDTAKTSNKIAESDDVNQVKSKNQTAEVTKNQTIPSRISDINTISNDNLKTSETPKEMFLVTKVVDGDTVTLDKIGTIRLIGINTPETVDPRKSVECFGKEASDKAKELLSGKKVYLEYDLTQGKTDKYNRTLAHVFREDGLHFNAEMIKTGYAYEYTYDKPYKYQNEFKQAQKDAQNNQLGLWSPSSCGGQLNSVKEEAKVSILGSGDVTVNSISNEIENKSIKQPINTSFDTNGDGKVTCPDFYSPVSDPQILSMFPKLDRDKDGVGCEGN